MTCSHHMFSFSVFCDHLIDPPTGHFENLEAAYVIFLFWQQASRATPWSAMVHSMDVHALLGAVE